MAEEIGFENGRNSNCQGLVTLTLTLDPAIRHTVMHHSSTSTCIPNFIEIEETFCGRTYGQFPPLILLGRLLEVDLKMTVVKLDFLELIITSLHLVIKQIIHFLDDGTDQRIHINTKVHCTEFGSTAGLRAM